MSDSLLMCCWFVSRYGYQEVGVNHLFMTRCGRYCFLRLPLYHTDQDQVESASIFARLENDRHTVF